MQERADYSAVEHLRDGRPTQIRALRPDDRAEMLAAIGRTSPQSLQRRFFAPKKGFLERPGRLRPRRRAEPKKVAQNAAFQS